MKSEKQELINLGYDPDTIEGDYREALHHYNRTWENINIDESFKFKNELDFPNNVTHWMEYRGEKPR